MYEGTQKLLELLTATNACLAAGAMAEFGIADLIPAGGSRSVRELASAAGCDEDHLYRTLRLLAGYGLFTEPKPRTFGLTPAGEAMREGAPNSTRAGWRLVHRLTRASVNGLEEGLRTGGTPAFIGFGQPIFDYLMAHPAEASIFDAGMTSIHGPETPAMLEAFDFGGIATLADIGGGNGSLLIGVLSRYPALRGLLFDLGHVIDRTRERIAAAGLADRCRVEAGSFFDSIPAGADAYLFRHIIHDWTDEQSTTILGHCRRVIPTNGRLLLVEAVVPSGEGASPAKDFDLAMLFYSGGRERTEEEYRALLAASGFALHSITPTASLVSVIEGRPV